ncbi:hypothetical protein [Paenibacillus thiaminolyticus]|uniref:hypothetical protein n=1 Tax=Paenibacillus thiaminolyticus TaxID=49283 RepID=UPI0016010FAB|nr:hypothetical protein [Paenibacillus thiaminolyticus]
MLRRQSFIRFCLHFILYPLSSRTEMFSEASKPNARWRRASVHKSIASTGLLPDFLYKDETDGQFKPVSYRKWNTDDGNFLESELDGEYNYNSCRTPRGRSSEKGTPCWACFISSVGQGEGRLARLHKFSSLRHSNRGGLFSIMEE